MTESELLELGKRLERVERSVRRYRAALGIVCLLLAVGLLSTFGFFATGHAHAATSAPAQIVARSFVLVDANGRTRAKLWVDHLLGQTSLSLYDQTGAARVSLAINYGPALLMFFDKAGKVRVVLGDNSGEPLVALYDKAETTRVGLSVGDDGPRLRLYDKAGKMRAALGTVPLENTATGSTETRAESSLVLFNQRGRVLWKAP